MNGWWASCRASLAGPGCGRDEVRQRTVAAFGKPLSPHLFRNAVATGIAISAPTQMDMVHPLLGHATRVTSERHYNLAGSLETGRRHESTIAALRQSKPRVGTKRKAVQGRMRSHDAARRHVEAILTDIFFFHENPLWRGLQDMQSGRDFT